MNIHMVCSTWVKEDDEKILKLLEKSDTWLSVEELSALTGLHPAKIDKTLHQLTQQMRLYESRKSWQNDTSAAVE